MMENNMDILGKSLLQLIDLVKKKELSADDVHAYFLNHVEDNDSMLNSFVTKPGKKKVNNADSLLAGLPLPFKDNYCTLGVRTTASSKVLDTFIPPYDATVVSRIKKAGGEVFGKTNMDAWAHGSSTETSDYGPTKNPWDFARVPGGSSGGSAAVVSAYLAPAALGTETAGSIRQPASWCGVVGLKPTYGRVSRYGVVAMGSSFDCPGPITSTVEDAAFLLQIKESQIILRSWMQTEN
jgi:aspartyl-tRNA(Asn)/glutamyl-tRNA(Gln) amidotransferase subunit A